MRMKGRLLLRSVCLLLAMALLPVSAFATGTSVTENDVTALATGITALQPPVLKSAAMTWDSVTVTADPSEEDAQAAIEYRVSSDNLVWNAWKTAGVFTELEPETVYYFQARYVTSDLERYANSEPSETITILTPEYVEPVLPKLTPPVLSGAEYMVKHNTIILNAVHKSSQDPDAVILYRMSTDQETWGEWQSNTRFDGLSPETKYYFQAMYYATERGLWADSEPGNIVSYTTKQGALTVSVRVIGVTEPTDNINFFLPKVDYKGAVHQNWIQTTVYEDVPSGTNAVSFLQEKLGENGFENQVSATNVSITATELFGGHTLTNKNDTTAWHYDIYGKNGAVRYSAQQFTMGTNALHDGDTVLLYYAFNATQEASNASSAYYRYFMNTPDAAVADYEKAYSTENMIGRIGAVTAGSGKSIRAAREAYDALDELQRSLVRNYDVLTSAETAYADMENAVKLEPPATPQCLGISANSIALIESEASSVDPDAIVQYRMSTDGMRWSEWQESYAFLRLRSETTYYFQARYWPSDLTKYEESEPSEMAIFKTSAPPVYTASNRQEWVDLVVNAPTDGREIIIEIIGDIEVGVNGVYTTTTPGGSNITMVGKGGKLLSPGGGKMNNGICVGNGATLTLRDLEYSSIGPWGDSYGVDQQTGNANLGSMIYLGGSNCTVNLENVTMYGDCSTGAALISKGTGTVDYLNNVVNIYSGTLVQLNGGSERDVTLYNGCHLINANGCTVNLRPKDDIILEGVILCESLRIIPEGISVKAVSSSNDKFSDRVDLAHDLERINEASESDPYKVNLIRCGGVRVIVSDDGTAFPVKLMAPEVNADMFVVDKAKVSVPSVLVSEEQEQAILQYRVFESSKPEYNLLPYQKWMSRPMTFDIELKEDTEYIFELRYHAIGGNYANSEGTTATLRTGYTTRVMEAPSLITAEEKTTSSITLRVPAVSEQDEKAAVEYRMSEDGETWEENWQTETLFEGLKAGTVYYFQSRFVPDCYLWLTSEPSSTLQVMTKTAILEAPILSTDSVEVNASSVTLVAPAASVQDRYATVEYRMAKDRISLESASWQPSATFTMLQPATTYYFQVRYVASSADWLDSAASEAVAIETGTSAQKPTFAMSNVSGIPGETVKVNIYIDGNPGIQAAKLTVNYDAERVTLQDEVTLGSVMGSFVPGKELTAGVRSFVFYTTDLCNTTKNGVLVTLEFRIKENAQGEIPVTVTYAADDVYDENEENVAFAVKNGTITVAETGTGNSLYGDVNGDGEVNQKDVTFLIKYLAERDVTIIPETSDLNGDNAVDLLDLLILRRHLAGWSGYGILPYVK